MLRQQALIKAPISPRSVPYYCVRIVRCIRHSPTIPQALLMCCGRERPFFKDLVSFVTRAPVIKLELSGENAVKKWRKLLGPTNAEKVSRHDNEHNPFCGACLGPKACYCRRERRNHNRYALDSGQTPRRMPHTEATRLNLQSVSLN